MTTTRRCRRLPKKLKKLRDACRASGRLKILCCGKGGEETSNDHLHKYQWEVLFAVLFFLLLSHLSSSVLIMTFSFGLSAASAHGGRGAPPPTRASEHEEERPFEGFGFGVFGAPAPAPWSGFFYARLRVVFLVRLHEVSLAGPRTRLVLAKQSWDPLRLFPLFRVILGVPVPARQSPRCQG